MNRARDQFLAGAAFPQDQDRIGVLGNFLDELVHALHAGRHAYECAKTGPALQLLAQQPVFLIHLDGMHQAIQLGAQLLHMEWFRDVVGRAEPGGLDGRLDRSILRQHDDGNFRIVGANSFDQFQAANLRDLQIRDDDVDRMLVENFQRLLRGPRRMNLKPGAGSHILAEIPRGYFVVHDQQA